MIELSAEIAAKNDAIKKPKVVKVTNSGKVTIEYSRDRIDEGNTSKERRLKNDEDQPMT